MNTNLILGLGYAGDTAGLTGGKDVDYMHRKMQKRLGLQFNSSKTVVVLFTRNSKLERQPSRQLMMLLN